MKRFALAICAVVGLALGAGSARAGDGPATYGGYQPWYNIFAHRNKCLTCEEERLQRFWHDYYCALENYYKALDRIDWVAYYKNHGYQINSGCVGPNGCPRINYAPVFVSPTMQWAVPNSCMSGPPSAPGAPVGYGGPMPAGGSCPGGGCGGY
jgi:hypothetical protein